MRMATCIILVLASTLACTGPLTSGTAPQVTATRQPTSTVTTEVGPEAAQPTQSENVSGLPADAEAYYQTMVFIEGTGQLLAKLDLAQIQASDNQTAFVGLFAMPGVMDDRVLAVQQSPVPDALAPAWDEALQSEGGMSQALTALLTTFSQDDFDKEIAANTAQASEAVSKAEAVLASDYGADEGTILTAKRAALTDMGQTYQAFASAILVGESQSGGGSP